MNKRIFFTATLFFSLSVFSQSSKPAETILRLSGGSVSFGTGDFLGYGLGIDLSKNVIAKAKPGLNKLMLGAEFLFENGVKNPVVQNPTIGEFFSTSFQHVSTSQLWIKGSYYPFGKIVKGFNIQVGPTLGYSYRSNEARATRVVDVFGNAVRESTLKFDNGFTVGYRISTGLQFDLNRKLQAGFRLDFSNNNEGEINTLAGLSMGLKL